MEDSSSDSEPERWSRRVAAITPLEFTDLLTPLSGLAQFYLTELEALGRRPQTIKTYGYAIRDFLEAAPPDPDQLERQHCLAWITSMRRRGFREGGIESYQRSVWTFLRWLHPDYVAVDFSRLPRVHAKEDQVHRPTAKPNEIRDMMDVAARQHEHPLRNRALVAVFADTGIRRSELAMVDFEDVDMQAGTIWVRHGKNGSQRLIGIGAEARACLWAYFTGKGLRGRGMQPGALFLARGGKRLSSGAMADVLEDLRRLANTDITSHQLRRYASVRMLTQDAPLDVAMHQLGHSSPVMTLRYGREGRAERSIREFHRLDQGIRQMR